MEFRWRDHFTGEKSQRVGFVICPVFAGMWIDIIIIIIIIILIIIVLIISKVNWVAGRPVNDSKLNCAVAVRSQK